MGPHPENNYQMRISLAKEKRGRWADLLLDCVKGCSITHQETGEMMGRMSFSKTLRLGGFHRAQLRPRYRELYRRVYNTKLPRLYSQTSIWRGRIIRPYAPLVCRSRTPPLSTG